MTAQPLKTHRPVARALAAVLKLLVLLLVCACQPASPSGNPRTLWINYSQREIDLVLVDYEPPLF